MKTPLLALLALLASSSFSQVAAPAPAPAAPARPSPRSLSMPSGPKFDALPPDEKEHIRRMAEFKAARDAAEMDLLRLDDEAQARKEAILAENEEAKALRDKAEELLAELAATTNALEEIYRADETLRSIADRIKPAKAIVDANQDNLTKEVVAAMHARMARQREAFAKENPPPPVPEETPELLRMTPEAYSNLVNRPVRTFGPGAPLAPNPDIKPPMAPRRPAPAPAPAGGAADKPAAE